MTRRHRGSRLGLPRRRGRVFFNSVDLDVFATTACEKKGCTQPADKCGSVGTANRTQKFHIIFLQFWSLESKLLSCRSQEMVSVQQEKRKHKRPRWNRRARAKTVNILGS